MNNYYSVTSTQGGNLRLQITNSGTYRFTFYLDSEEIYVQYVSATTTTVPVATTTTTVANTTTINIASVSYKDMVSITGGTYSQTDGTTSFSHTISAFQMGKYEVTYELWYTVKT